MTEATARELIAALQANTEVQKGILGVLLEDRDEEPGTDGEQQPSTYMDGSPR